MHSVSRACLCIVLIIIVIGISVPLQENAQIIKTQNINFYTMDLSTNETQKNTVINNSIEVNNSKSVFLVNSVRNITFDPINNTSTLENSSTVLSKANMGDNDNNKIREAEPRDLSDKNVITFGTGIHDLNQTMQVNSNTLILGQQGSLLRFFGNSYLNLTGDNITVCGLTIEGDGLNDEFGIRAKGNFITIENCSVKNVGNVGFFGFGITFEYGSTYGLITENQVQDIGLDGIHIRGNINTTISNNTIINSNDDGIASIFGYSNLIANNSINRQGTINPSGNGIYIADIGTTIEENYIENTPLNGIAADSFQGYQASQIDILNNTIKNAGILSTGIRCSGILLNYVCDSNVTGNIIDNSLYYGIRVYNGSRNYIAQNIISNWCGAEDNWGGGTVLEYQSSYNFVSANEISNETYFFAETGLGVDHNRVQFTDVSLEKIHIEGLNSILLSN